METVVDPKKGKTIYRVVDGQQRLRAVFGFIDGEYELRKKHAPSIDEDLDGLKFQELPEKYQKIFWSYGFHVEVLEDADKHEIEDMFVRLNKNTIKLNAQELRNALYHEGDFCQLSYDLADDDYWEEQKIVSRNDIQRMKNVEFISDLLIAIMYGILTKKGKTIDKYYADNMEMENKSKVKKQFLKVKNKIEDILPELRETRFNNKSDFYALFYTIYDFLESGYSIDESNIVEIRKALTKFSKAVKMDSEDSRLAEYYDMALHRTDSEINRKFMHKTLKGLIEPILKKR